MEPQASQADVTRAAGRERLRGLFARLPLHGALLAIIILTAFTLRALRCTEGLPYLHQWDEPQTASTALRILQTGDFNPHFFHYGSLMIYLNVGVDAVHYLHLMTKPETDPASLYDLYEIETSRDTGYHWTISHPSFFLWNRLLTALLGTGSVLIAYFIAREVKGRWAGILAAGLLAGVDFDITHSALVTPNVPVAFFGALAVLLSLLFARRGSAALLVGSAAVCGLAASTKYNAVVSIVAPVLALSGAWWRGRLRPGGWSWAAVALVPPLAFLAGTPYAVLDLPGFLWDVGYEIRHYEVLGHNEETIEPGVTNALHQMRTMTEQIGVLPTAFALLGLGVALAARPGRIAFVYPLVYLALMSGTRVAFHRNFLVLYPFVCVAFGCGVAAAGEILGAVRPGSVLLGRARAAIFVVAAAACVVGSAVSLSTSWRIATTPESRSLAIDRINDLAAGAGPAPLVGIAGELGIHRIDLARLKVKYEVAPLIDLMCADRARYDMVVTAKEFRGDRLSERAGGEIMNSMARAWTSNVTRMGGPRWHHLSNLNKDPGILILARATDGAESFRCTAPLDLRWKDPDDEATMRTGPEVKFGLVASAGTDWVAVAPGPHAFTWFAEGITRSGIEPQIRCTLRIRFGGIEAVRERKIFELSKMRMFYALPFEAPEGAEFSVSFERSEGGEISVWSVRSVELPREASTGAAAGATGQ